MQSTVVLCAFLHGNCCWSRSSSSQTLEKWRLRRECFLVQMVKPLNQSNRTEKNQKETDQRERLFQQEAVVAGPEAKLYFQAFACTGDIWTSHILFSWYCICSSALSLAASDWLESSSGLWWSRPHCHELSCHREPWTSIKTWRMDNNYYMEGYFFLDFFCFFFGIFFVF